MYKKERASPQSDTTEMKEGVVSVMGEWTDISVVMDSGEYRLQVGLPKVPFIFSVMELILNDNINL